MKKKKRKNFFIVLIIIPVLVFLIIVPKLRALNFASSETTSPAINYLHELEKSNGKSTNLYNNGTPVVLV